MLYQKQEKQDKNVEADDSLESSDEEVDENELEDIKSETEDAILKENAAKEAGRIMKDE